jgi:L,D-peptidoglycan transpeptidase YkuD (ErfK/YbiS/YcfS/YnhG family)
MRLRPLVWVILVVTAAALATGRGAGARAVWRPHAPARNRALTLPRVPTGAEQLLVVSSPTSDPPGDVATFRAYSRSVGGARWHQTFGPWPAETGIGDLLPAAVRREGDGATPIGIFGVGPTIYGNQPNPGGLHSGYHRLGCGDWWDEDPYTPGYNEFVQVPCGVRPGFASWSEALWTETVAYPYFAVIQFNTNPTIGGSRAPGSAIFLHSWIGAPTHGCIALHESELLTVLRWLQPAEHPVIEIAPRAS